MKMRIHPRVWRMRASPGVLKRRPLTLVFRKRTKAGDLRAPAPAPLAAPGAPAVFVTNVHRHTHQGPNTSWRLFQNNAYAMAGIRERAAMERIEIRRLETESRVLHEKAREQWVERHVRFIASTRREKEIQTTTRNLLVFGDAAHRPLMPGGAGCGIETLSSRAITRSAALKTRLHAPVAEPSAARVASRVTIHHKHTQTVNEYRLAKGTRASLEAATEESRTTPFTRRPAEQVWRKATQARHEAGAGPAASSRSGTIQAAEVSSVRSEPRRVEALAAPSPATLRFDGPAMERLAEDVMKRIERHLRIERERRGI